MKYSRHFIEDVLPKRPYLTTEILQEIIRNPLKVERQEDRKIKLWGYTSVYNKYIRIILLEDEETVHTAFFDRNFPIK